MKTRVIVDLLAVLVFSLLADSAFAVTKITPTQAEAGRVFTIIDAPQGRLVDGSVAVFRLDGSEVVLPGRTHVSYSTMQGRLSPDMFGGEYSVFVRQPDRTEFEIGPFTVLAPKLIAPYVSESDMREIGNIFTSDLDSSPSNYVHDGLDIYPEGDLKAFQAACSGRVQRIYTFDEQVIVFIACNPTYTTEYNFESQAPQTGQIQLDNIMVVEGQTVSQGDIVGYLYAAANPDNAHVHFTVYKNWIPSCPEPYFDQAARDSVLDLIDVKNPGFNMCYGPEVAPDPLLTPYLTELDMSKISAAFSSENSDAPWGFAHDGIDIHPQGDLKPFQASCSGTVDSVQLRQAGVDSNWQVEVLIQCENYVFDPLLGGYFIPFSVEYIFEPMSDNPIDGQAQLGNIMVVEGQLVFQGDIVGYLDVAGEEAHVHFGLVQFGSSLFSALGITSIPLCPEPHFSTEAKASILNLLHVAWPRAGMCYQN